MAINHPLLAPEWPQLPSRVHAYSTTRHGGVSQKPYNSLNLGDHVGDDPLHVAENRRIICELANVPNAPCWLEQVHGTRVLTLDGSRQSDCKADASYTRTPGEVCVVMTADCLPVLFSSDEGTEVAAAHAGWRGLCDGVLENTLSHFQADTASISVWLGPAIGPRQFEVGAEVREKFIAHHEQTAQAFIPHGEKYLADIYHLAQIRLEMAGITRIYGGEYCTVSEPEVFFSYRREREAGRMASFIWFS